MKLIVSNLLIGIWTTSFALLITACVKTPEVYFPVEVTWTGKLNDGYHGIALPNQEVFLVDCKLVGPPGGTDAWMVFGDTVQTTFTDSEGNFSFKYADQNERCCWYCIRASHQNYLDNFEAARNHPAVENYHQDLFLKPKTWLKIRILDIPEQTIAEKGITFFNLNTSENYFWYSSCCALNIHPSQGDTTFYAFKQGGELAIFGYYNSDSITWVSYKAIFPPFDTTELIFTY